MPACRGRNIAPRKPDAERPAAPSRSGPVERQASGEPFSSSRSKGGEAASASRPRGRACFMALIVQKYGGTSVGNTERIRNVARPDRGVPRPRRQACGRRLRHERRHRQADRNWRARSCRCPSEREMDMLLATGEQTTIALTAMALHALGVPAMLPDRRPGRHRHRRRPYQGQDPQHHPQKDPRAARRRQGRHRGRVPGPDRRKARSRPWAAAVPI